MPNASMHGTLSLASLLNDGGVALLVVHLEGRPFSFAPYTAMFNFN